MNEPDPVFAVIARFNCAIEPLYRQVNLNDQDNAELTQLRDWIPPLLMNGPVRVA